MTVIDGISAVPVLECLGVSSKVVFCGLIGSETHEEKIGFVLPVFEFIALVGSLVKL